MSAPNPGPGWREVDPDADLDLHDTDEVLSWIAGANGPIRRWVLTPPKPLPTEEGTVIRIVDGRGAGVWTRSSVGWTMSGGSGDVVSESILQEALVGPYDIVAAPPATIANAVLGAIVEQGITTADDSKLAAVAQQYGLTLGTPQP